jgi:hypothetical protein
VRHQNERYDAVSLGGRNLEGDVNMLRTDYTLLSQRVTGVSESVASLRAELIEKHKENRLSIHDLRENDQTIMDSLHKIDLAVTSLTGRIIGYCSAAGVAMGIIFKLLDMWKH